MRKRLRNKRHMGEFQEVGFEVKFSIKPGLSTTERSTLLDRFIIEAIEGNGLIFGGGGSNEWDGMVGLSSGSATNEHIEKVEEWLKKEPNVTSCQTGELIDLWHGNFE